MYRHISLLLSISLSLSIYIFLYIYTFITFTVNSEREVHIGEQTKQLYMYIYIQYIYIYRLPPLPPTSQKVGWGRLLEALADLGCSLVAFCGIWDALGSAGQPK